MSQRTLRACQTLTKKALLNSAFVLLSSLNSAVQCSTPLILVLILSFGIFSSQHHIPHPKKTCLQANAASLVHKFASRPPVSMHDPAGPSTSRTTPSQIRPSPKHAKLAPTCLIRCEPKIIFIWQSVYVQRVTPWQPWTADSLQPSQTSIANEEQSHSRC